MSEVQIVIFGLNDQVCGVDALQIKEIMKYQELTKAPETPSFVDGLLTTSEGDIPIINLNTRFDLGKTTITKKTKIFISEIDAKYIGFMVNEINIISKFPESEIKEMPNIVINEANKCMSRIVEKDNTLITIIDFKKILSKEELAQLFLD